MLELYSTIFRGEDIDLVGCDNDPKQLCRNCMDDRFFLTHDILLDSVKYAVACLTCTVAKESKTVFMFESSPRLPDQWPDLIDPDIFGLDGEPFLEALTGDPTVPLVRRLFSA